MLMANSFQSGFFVGPSPARVGARGTCVPAMREGFCIPWCERRRRV